ncbi:MAG: glucan 1,4-alpha-glucosidase [Psychrobium sp.]
MKPLFKPSLIAVTLASALGLAGCGEKSSAPETAVAPAITAAPGAPGAPSTWAYAGKTGIGSSYEAYKDLAYSDEAATGKVSKVWFSLAQGIITETMFGLIHEAQIKDMQFVVTGKGFVDTEQHDTVSTIDYLYKDDAGRPLSLAYKIVNKDKEGKYSIEKHIFTDPSEHTLFVKTYFTAYEDGITANLVVNPHVNNNGSNDMAVATKDSLSAEDSGSYLTVLSDTDFAKTSVGFIGKSDGLTDLKDGTMDWQYQTTGEVAGNVGLTAQFAPVALNGKESVTVEYDIAVGFGHSKADSESAAKTSLKRGYKDVLAHYNGEGEHLGWEDYLASLSGLPAMTEMTTDNGKLLYTSALVLKAQEDKTHAGALIASLSNPWGDAVSAEKGHTGYKAVWPRDFYQCAMALLALGDEETPLVSFNYLEKVQVSDKFKENKGDGGWFLQKTHVDGTIEWVGVQLDQTAMPIMLGWKLWQNKVLSDDQLVAWYNKMLKPAADFLVKGGTVNIDWNNTKITPPMTQQERWEEQSGHSPSTTAAIITGLAAAADIAKLAGDKASAELYEQTATKYAGDIEKLMFTDKGAFTQGDDNGRYYIRINKDKDVNDSEKLNDNNGKPGLDKKSIVDGGFLELVRYGVRSADDAAVLDSLVEYDSQNIEDNLRVKYNFTFDGVEGTFPGWRRYGNDGYGEDIIKGRGYHATGKNIEAQRGRVWPFFTGERGHYELAAAKLKEQQVSSPTMDKLRNTYVRTMELFANEGMMLPEQVWDGVGSNEKYGYKLGQGTNGATPLAWTHAEYVKLLRSYADQQVWDNYSELTDQFKHK